MACTPLIERTQEILASEVPRLIARYQQSPVYEIVRKSRRLSSEIHRLADLIEGGATLEEVEKAAHTLAEGVAVSAFYPGGIKVVGLHFEAQHPAINKRS